MMDARIEFQAEWRSNPSGVSTLEDVLWTLVRHDHVARCHAGPVDAHFEARVEVDNLSIVRWTCVSVEEVRLLGEAWRRRLYVTGWRPEAAHVSVRRKPDRRRSRA